MKKSSYFLPVLLSLLLGLFFLSGCQATGEEHGQPVTETGTEADGVLIGEAPGEETAADTAEDIVVLYTGDVHCAAEEGIGYAGVAALKKELSRQYSYVTLVDCGDFTQGRGPGAVSGGLYPLLIMNQAGYDFAVLGNHEFDYGLETLHTNLMAAEFRCFGCNLEYTGSGTDPFFGMAPWEIVNYGGTKVAFIGVTTPDTKKTTRRSLLEEDGIYVVDFHGDPFEDFCGRIQNSVDDCRQQGAEYVILMAHLGINSDSEYASENVIRATSGIDVVLDAHSHTRLEAEYLPDRNGTPVLRTSSGTGFQSVGQLTITKDGEIRTRLITEYSGRDQETQDLIDRLDKVYDEDVKLAVGSTEFRLTDTDDDGVTVIRARETNMGDFCTDAIRGQRDARIAVLNAGAICAGFAEGEITRENVYSVFPYFDGILVIRLKGSNLLDALEMGAEKTQKEYSDGREAVGTQPGFLQVSGLRYTIDTSVPSSVEKDQKGNFLRVAGEYRVKDVYVQNEDGSTEPLDPDQYYSVAVSDFLQEGGDGMTMFVDAEILDGSVSDSELLIDYIRSFPEGKIPEEYRTPQKRIRIK